MTKAFYTGFPGILILIVGLAACGERTPDEAQIRSHVKSMIEAVETHKTEPVMERLAENFRGPEGMDARMLRRFIVANTLRKGKIRIYLRSHGIRIEGKNAISKIAATVTGGGRLLPDEMRHVDAELIWRKDGEGWKLVRADWTQGAIPAPAANPEEPNPSDG